MKIIPSTHLWKLCASKVPFTKKKFADAIIEKMKHRKGMAAYKCTLCEKWHIGHVPKGR